MPPIIGYVYDKGALILCLKCARDEFDDPTTGDSMVSDVEPIYYKGSSPWTSCDSCGEAIS